MADDEKGMEVLAAEALARLGLAPGERLLERYELGGLLGAGAMGIVFEARQVVLDQPVAVKMLVGAADDPRAEARFVREARALAKIKSPHVARVLDAATVRGVPCIVLERLRGIDLHAWLKARGPLSVSNACTLGRQAADALGEAHRSGIVHRDLKPSNVFVVEERGVIFAKILDFGVAKLMAGFDQETRMATRSIAGTPDYMAPEQIDGLEDLDGRADVWSLGVLLYELVSGARPFHGATFSQLIRHITGEPHVPLATHLPAVDARFAAVIDRCLAKSRSERFASMADLAGALAPFVVEGEAACAAALLAESVASPSRIVSVRTGSSSSSSREAFSQTMRVDESGAGARARAADERVDAFIDAPGRSPVASAHEAGAVPGAPRGDAASRRFSLPLVAAVIAAALVAGTLAIRGGGASGDHAAPPAIAAPAAPAAPAPHVEATPDETARPALPAPPPALEAPRATEEPHAERAPDAATRAGDAAGPARDAARPSPRAAVPPSAPPAKRPVAAPSHAPALLEER